MFKKATYKVLFRALVFFAVMLSGVTLHAQLKADFTATPVSGCSPLIVGFSDKSTGNPTSWKWDLGNGVISTSRFPSTTYFEPGAYTIKLVVYKGTEADSITKNAYINVYGLPEVDFSASPLSGCYPLDVSFIDKSVAASGNINSWLWDFGDGNTSTESDPVHTYTSPGAFGVSLMVTSSLGCTKTLTKDQLINIQQGVQAAFMVSSSDICHTPAVYTFLNQSTGTGNLSYYWQFGDGGTSTKESPSHSYANPGTYSVLLTVTSSTGCVDTASLMIDFSFPKTNFYIPPTICSNQPQQITNNTTPTPVSVAWDFGDGTTSTIFSPVKTYTNSGNYTIRLINEFSDNCKDTAYKTVQVIDGPAASFKVTDTASCSTPYTVHFQNTTVGNAISFVWDFGDGTKSTEMNPEHTYTKYGTYTVTLTATNSNGCQTIYRVVDCIRVRKLSVSGFEGLPVTGCVPYTIQPKPIANFDLKNATYKWDFGDGTTSTSANPIHTYSQDGDYTVKLTLTTPEGCETTYEMQHAVVVGHKPKADFFADPLEVCAKYPITFTSTSTNGPITGLEWHFGDGSISYDNPVAIHKFGDTGYFTITLIAFNNGCADTIEKERYVHIKPPNAKFTFENNCTDRQSVQFKDKSQGDLVWNWDFGDGTQSTDKNPKHTYAAPGSYNVVLTVANNTCDDTARQTVKVVNEKPLLDVFPFESCKNVEFTFSIKNVDSANIVNTTWDFGDGSKQVINGVSVKHSYVKAGSYQVTVIVRDILGCTDTLIQTNNVTIYGPSAKFNAVKNAGCIQESFEFTDASTTDGTHPITKWVWDFGDDNKVTTTGGPVQHAYLAAGSYDVKLTVSDNYGCSDSVRKKNYITITQPKAAFNISDSIVCPDKKINFTSTSEGAQLTYKWDFKDGTFSTQEAPSHTYSVQGTYYPQLLVVDANTCRDSVVSLSPILVSIPEPRFTMSDSFATCPPLNVLFTNTSENYKSFSWDFGDGNTSTVFSPSHLYNAAGIFPAKLKVTGNGGCTDSLTKNIVIKGPSGNIIYDPVTVCYPGEITFTSKAVNTVQYVWDFSDGTTLTTSENKATHIYQPGSYVPKLILSDAFGCQVPIKGIDTIHAFDVTAVPTAISHQFCDSGTVVFTDSSYSNDIISNYHWIFPDNSTADGKQVSHIFTTAGTYQVKLIVTTQNGCKDTSELFTPIQISVSPEISILGDSTGCAPLSLSFNGHINSPDSSALSWNWDFGNGAVSNLQNPLPVSYTTAGQYTITTIAVNAAGCADTAQKRINLLAPPNVSAGFDTSICKFSSIVLQPSGALNYVWDYSPDLNCSDCTNPIASPDSTATFVVHGTNEYGCSASDTITLMVIQPTTLATSGSDSLCVGGTVQLHAQGALTYKWTPTIFLDDPTSPDPVMHATKDTLIHYQVTGAGQKNCFVDTGTVTIKVYPIPGMQIIKDNITMQAGQPVRLETTSTPDITQWRWEPSTGLDNPTIANPMANPLQTTTYTCVAVNGGGCLARDMVTVYVLCDKNNIFIPNTFSPNHDGVNDAFYPRGTGLFSVKSIKIFNRWGELVYSNKDVTPNDASGGWDGTYKGKPAPADVYVYIMEITCENSKVIPMKGNVTLIR